MAASGISYLTAPLALAAGAAGVGVGSAINKLNSDIAMVRSSLPAPLCACDRLTAESEQVAAVREIKEAMQEARIRDASRYALPIGVRPWFLALMGDADADCEQEVMLVAARLDISRAGRESCLSGPGRLRGGVHTVLPARREWLSAERH